VEEPVENEGPPGRWEVQPGGAGLPLRHGCGKAGVPRTMLGVRLLSGSAGSGKRRERRREELGTREELPLFLSTPSVMASAGEE